MFGFNTRRTQVLFWVRQVLCTSVGVLFLSLLTAVSASAVVTEPPTVGTGGTLGVLAGDPWTVCRADTSTAWLSANVGGTYNAEAICQSLGYSEVDAKGGTCGTVCGYCGTVGQETYDDSGGAITSLSSTVNWRCAGATFVPDTEGPTVTLDPVSGTYMPGDTVVLTAHLSEPITSYLNQNFIGTNATQVGAGNYSEPDLTFNVFVQIVAGGAATVQLGAGYFIDAADNASAASNVVSITVLDTVDETQDMRADFALRRAANLIRNQPDLTGMLRGQGGSASADTTRGQGQFLLSTPGGQPVWAHLTGNWTRSGSVEDEYFLGAVGAHANLSPDLIVGGMVQFDHARSTDGAAMIEGDGWLVGPYMVARLGAQPLFFEASLLYGDSSNRISPDGTYTDRFDAKRALAQIKLSGEMTRGAVTLMPHLGVSHAVERQDGYTDGLGQVIAKQTVRLTELRYGLDFSLPLAVSSGTMDLTGGLSGIYADVGGDAADSAFAAAYEGNRAMLELGLARHFASGADLSFGSYYDGIGVDDFESWGLKLSYSTQF